MDGVTTYCPECGTWDTRERVDEQPGEGVVRLVCAKGHSFEIKGYVQARLDELAYQHDMDCGGYSWENVDPELLGIEGLVAWDDPDFDYLLGETPEATRGRSVVFYWAPGDCGVTWPERYEDGEDTWVLVDNGSFYDRDHECTCMHDGGPIPECNRCHGEGYLDCDAGDFGVYVMEEEE
jgi:hypothetical protein